MSRLPRLPGNEIIRALTKFGFEVVRIKGSHHFHFHPDGRATVVRLHSEEIIELGLLTKILRDYDLTHEQIEALLLIRSAGA